MSKALEQRIVDYLVEKYHPVALLIHGSRANGHAREHSDWDFAMFVSTPVPQTREIIFEKENIDIRIFTVPVDIEKIREYCFYFERQNVRVIFDPEYITEDVIREATKVFNTPITHTPAETIACRARLRVLIDGMIDYQYEQASFFRKLSEFYQYALKYWFLFLNNSYMQQVYKSLPIIATKDKEYFKLLEILSENHTKQEKISAAEKLYERFL
ncbi:MAG TPA: nucleotidyltransferase domain-containing protein [Candidatus Paceibacterota bacterium]|jgi:hypothetical protein|nr:nucleotidyltransferase domain-containing protein [Candidatus Paceibacterota bacterium]